MREYHSRNSRTRSRRRKRNQGRERELRQDARLKERGQVSSSHNRRSPPTRIYTPAQAAQRKRGAQPRRDRARLRMGQLVYPRVGERHGCGMRKGAPILCFHAAEGNGDCGGKRRESPLSPLAPRKRQRVISAPVELGTGIVGQAVPPPKKKSPSHAISGVVPAPARRRDGPSVGSCFSGVAGRLQRASCRGGVVESGKRGPGNAVSRTRSSFQVGGFEGECWRG